MTHRIASFVVLLAGALTALATPRGSCAQSLSDTLDIVRNAVASQGSVVWQGYVHEGTPAAGERTDWTYERRLDVTDFAYDLPNCGLAFHYRVATNGAVSSETDVNVSLHDISVANEAGEQNLVRKRDAQAGHPARISQIQPPIYDVDLSRKDGSEIVFSFYDEQSANQVADAFDHAIALCRVSGPGAN